MKSGKKSYLAQVRPSRTITSGINSKNRNRIRIELSGSASHRPRCLPDRWPESYSPRQETRRPQRPYSFPWAKRPSSLAARHEPPRPTACRRPAASPSHRSPAPRPAAHPAPPPARSALGYVRVRAAMQMSALSDRQGQTQLRRKQIKAYHNHPSTNNIRKGELHESHTVPTL